MTVTTEMQNSADVHRSALVIDTHADTPQRFVDEGFDFAGPLNGGNLNLATAREGNLAAVFFAIFVEPERYKGRHAHRALQLIDGVKRQMERHADEVAFVTSPEGIVKAHREHKFAALMGIEGGHCIEGSLALLRQFHALGARYMSLTWNNSNGWADSSGDLGDPAVTHTEDGLSDFGKQVIGEMNRLGMMVDVSHVADRTFFRVLDISRAPVIASHSSARALCNSPRNLTDEMIGALANSGEATSHGGVVMVNFYSAFLSQAYLDEQQAMRPEVDRAVEALKGKAQNEGREVSAVEIERLERSFYNRIPRPPFSLLIDHIDHIAKVGGIDHVGLGSDFDGICSQLPEGMNSPADFLKITAALMARGYTADGCRKILGDNLLRLFREIEETSKTLHE